MDLYYISGHSFSIQNNLCIPESFNTNITQQLFDCIITFVNSKTVLLVSLSIPLIISLWKKNIFGKAIFLIYNRLCTNTVMWIRHITRQIWFTIEQKGMTLDILFSFSFHAFLHDPESQSISDLLKMFHIKVLPYFQNYFHTLHLGLRKCLSWIVYLLSQYTVHTIVLFFSRAHSI